MLTDLAAVKKEKSIHMGVPRHDDSDSDDSVIHVPYVKPTPPVISLDDSDEGEPADEPPSRTLIVDAVSVELDSTTTSTSVTQSVSEPSQKTKKKRKSKSKETNLSQKSNKKENEVVKKNKKNRLDKGNECNSATASTFKAVKKRNKNKNKSVGDVIGSNTSPVADAEGILLGQVKSKNSSITKKKRSGDAGEASTSSKKGKKKSKEVLVLGEQALGHAPSIQQAKEKRRKANQTEEFTLPSNVTMSAADIDHLKFLKTLNLEVVGVSENDLLRMALSPADFSIEGRNRFPPKKQKSKVSKAGEKKSSRDETSSATSVASSIDIPATSTGSQKEFPKEKQTDKEMPLQEHLSTQNAGEEAVFASKADPVTGINNSEGFVFIVEDKSKGLKKSYLYARNTSSNQSASNSSSTVNTNTRATSEDESDNVGHFTAEELNQVRSNLQIHVTGVENFLTGSSSNLTNPSHDDMNECDDPPASTFTMATASGSTRDFTAAIAYEGASEKLGKRKRKRDSGEGRHKRKKSVVDDLSVGDVEVERVTVRDVNSERLMKSRSYPSSWTPHMINFYGKVDPQFPELDKVLQQQSDSPRLWRIPQDQQVDRLTGKQIRCDNCSSYGSHFPEQCPKPRRQQCVMCGERGHRTNCMYPISNSNNVKHYRKRADECNQRIQTSCAGRMCLNCGNSRLAEKDYVQKCSNCSDPKTKCGICGCKHFQFECPDSWRKFHSTCIPLDDRLLENYKDSKAPLQTTPYRLKSQSYCSNCGLVGHNYYQCTNTRGFNRAFHPNKPTIIKELPEVVLPVQEQSKQSVILNTPGGVETEQPPAVDTALVGEKQPLQQKTQDIVDRAEEPKQSQSVASTRDRASTATGSVSPKELPSPIPIITLDDDPEIIELDTLEQNESVSSMSCAPRSVAATGPMVAEKSSSVTVQISNDGGDGMATPKAPDNTESSQKAIEVCSKSVPEDVIITQRHLPVDPHRLRENAEGKHHSILHCDDYPDCQNVKKNKKECFKIRMKSSNHWLALKADKDQQVVRRLNGLYSGQNISISLRRHAPEFHIAGDKYWLPRDKILRLIHYLVSERDISVLLLEATNSKNRDDCAQSENKQKGNDDCVGGNVSKLSDEVKKLQKNSNESESCLSKETNESSTPNSKTKEPGTWKDSLRGSSSTANTSNTNNSTIVQNVVFDPKYLSQYESRPLVDKGSSHTEKSAGSNKSISDDNTKQSKFVSTREFERKLRKIVCAVPLADNPEGEGRVAISSKNCKDSNTESVNSSNATENNRRSDRLKSNRPGRDTRGAHQSRYNSRSRFSDNDGNHNYRSANNSFRQNGNYFENRRDDSRFANSNGNYNQPPHNWNARSDIDERNLPFEQRQQQNYFMNPSSPFYYSQPQLWQNNSGESFRAQSQYSNNDFHSDNFFPDPNPILPNQNFPGFFIDCQPQYHTMEPSRGPPPYQRYPPVSFRSRGKRRGFSNKHPR